MQSLIIGCGEIGLALYRVLHESYGIDKVHKYDKKDESKLFPDDIDILNICIPYSNNFVNIVNNYVSEIKPKHIIIHSSVPVGTTAKIRGIVFHSPVMGKHPNIYEGLLQYKKFLSYSIGDFNDVQIIYEYFVNSGLEIIVVPQTKSTELMKLLELSRYGVYIAFAKEQESICNKFGLEYENIVSKYERNRNEGLDRLKTYDSKQPILYPFKDYVGGHCTVEDMELLLAQVDAPLLQEAYRIDKATTIWNNCNIYETAIIGKGCSVGQFSEIGKGVVIGNNVRIGAYTFIPEGVTIEDNVFIAPRVSFSNDKYPPSGKEKWGRILVKKNAVIGMGSVILPGITIGENAVIGAGSIVTKNVPAFEVWYGTAAYSHGKKEGVYTG